MTVTQLLDVDNMARWIQRDGVENILAGLSRYLESDLRRWQDFEKIPRLASHTDFGVSELMPTSDAELFSVKYVNGHQLNPARGLQTVTAYGGMDDVENGYPVRVAEMALATALPTAALSPLAARGLHPPDAQRHDLIGAGSQAESQALAFRTVLGLEQLRVFDLDSLA